MGWRQIATSSAKGAKREKHALSLASGNCTRKDVEYAGAGGDGEKRRSCEKENQEVSIQHLIIVAVGSIGMEIGYETNMADSFSE